MKPWIFTHATDLHLGSPKSYRFDPSRNKNWDAAKQQMAAMNTDLVLIGGDVTRDGDTHEFEYELVKRDFETLPFPAFVIPGNMDVGNKHTDRQGAGHEDDDRDDIALNYTSERMDLFSSYFGAPNWTFMHKDVRFTAFYDGVFGSGLPEEDRLWKMLEYLPSLPQAKHHVVVIHYALLIDQLWNEHFDLSKKEEYLSWYFCIGEPHRSRLLDIFRAAQVDLVFSGHIHLRRPVQHLEGFRYFQGAAVGGRPQWEDKYPDGDPTIGFYRCEVSESGIKVSFVPVDPLATEEGYGPYGHPPMEKRDYSVAWEK